MNKRNLTSPNLINMKILDISDETIPIIVDKINNGEVVILPGNGVYTFNTNIFNKKSIEKINLLKEKTIESPFTLAVTGFEMITPFINITEFEKKLLKLLVDNFWPGPLNIVVKTNLDDPTYSSNKFVSFKCDAHNSIQQIITELDQPIITTSANISNKVSFSHINHVENYFKDVDITVLKNSENSKYAIENTIIKINNNNISILRPGIITKKNILDIFEGIDINIDYINEYEKHGCLSTHYSIDKNCVLANFITTEKLNKKFNKLTFQYLEKSILVDFGKRNWEKKELCGGYVDLSEKGDIKEALFNIYDVLHQLNNLSIKNIIFINFYKQFGLYKTLLDKLQRCCSKNIMIPLSYT